MTIDSATQDFIKTNQGMLKRMIEILIQDYFNRVVDEEDPSKKEVLSLMVKELRMAVRMIDNFSNVKQKVKKEGEEYSGV